MDLIVQLNELLNHKPGYLHWSELVSFFTKHIDELTNEQKRKIYYRCENYREQHNKRFPNDNIRREEIHPIIYSYSKFLEEKDGLLLAATIP